MPDQMQLNDKDKDLQPLRPPVEVSDKDELNTLPTPNGEVELETLEGELSPREAIYKNHDTLHRPSTQPNLSTKGYVEEQTEESVAEDVNLEESEEGVQRQKPGPKAQVEVTVNGNTRKVDKAKVDAAGGVEAYQMMVAGQEKLRLISAREKAVRDQEAAFQKRQEEFEKRTLAAPAEEPERPRTDLATSVEDQQSDLRNQAAEALLDGDVKESVRLNALADRALLDAATNNAVRHIETTQREQEAMRKANERRAGMEQGIKNFAIDFPELMADKNLMNLADNHTESIVKEHPDWSPSEVMHEAGRTVVKWMADQKKGVTREPTSIELKALEKWLKSN